MGLYPGRLSRWAYKLGRGGAYIRVGSGGWGEALKWDFTVTNEQLNTAVDKNILHKCNSFVPTGTAEQL